MHRSRLGGLIIDCRTDDLDGAAEFWGQALGLRPRPTTNLEDEAYVSLVTAPNDIDIDVQKVGHPSRVHLDIETDDIEAEVRRLAKLGAREVARIRDWVIMEAPTGQQFCVVSPQRSEFATEANRWT